MKKFKDLSIGDHIFYLNESNKAVPLQIEGVRNCGLKDMEYTFYIRGGGSFTTTGDKESFYDKQLNHYLFVSQERVRAERELRKASFMNDQIRIAVNAFRILKACDHNLEKTRERFEKLLQYAKDKLESE